MKKTSAVLFACLASLSRLSLAQGGPPLVTDDPETPGAGKWETNFAVIYLRSRDGRSEVAAPDVDMNYGWGENIQLKLDVPWVFARESGEPWKSGLGRGNAGVKWRFIDEEKSGYSVSTYPQYTWNILSSSESRGITESGHEFLLPIEISKKVGEVGLDAEIGRNFVNHGNNQWVIGGIVAPKCGEKLECLFEIHETFAPHEHQTLVNVGMRWKMSEAVSFLAAIGREFGTTTDEQRHALVYAGFQVLR